MKWQQAGQIFLWRYRCKGKAFEGLQLHITADPVGCDSLMELLLQLKGQGHGSEVASLTEVTPDIADLPGLRCRDIDRYERLKIWLRPQIIGNGLRIRFKGGEAQIEVGQTMIEEFRIGINDVKHGDGDWNICDEEDTSLAIWFWPLAGQSYPRQPPGGVSGRGWKR